MVLGVERFLKSRALRTIDSAVNNQIGRVVSDIDNPILRQGAQNFLDTLFPGLGGGTPDLRDNAFAELVTAKQAASLTEQQLIINERQKTKDSGVLSDSYDWRARLRPKNGGIEQFYADIGRADGGVVDYLMRPIKNSNGFVFPNTPTVFLSASANYDQSDMQGQNYSINTYRNTTLQPLSVTAELSANDIYEARYMLGVLTFLKIACKSYYGDAALEDGTYGMPPPVLLFEYMGEHGFNKVPVVLTNYTVNFPSDIDYVPVVTGTNESEDPLVTYVPSKIELSIILLPTYTPQKMRKKFDLQKIANGSGYKDGFI